MLTSLLVAFALLSVDDAQPSQQPVAGTSREQAEERDRDDADGDRVICERQHVVGSNFPRRVCRTKSEWDAIRDDSNEALRDLDSRGSAQDLPSTPAG